MGYDEYYMMTIAWVGFCIYIEIIIFTVTICQINGAKTYKFSKYHHRLTILAMIGYIITDCIDISHLTIRYLHFPDRHYQDEKEALMGSTSDATYFFGNIIFYILLLSNVYISFRLNRFMLNFTVGFLFLSTLSSIYWCFIVFYDSGQNNEIKFSNALNVAIIPLFISDLILNLTLFILFIYKLKTHPSLKGRIIDDITNYNKQVMMFNVMIKHIVLFTPVIVLNQLFYISTFFQTGHSRDPFPILLTTTYSMRTLENISTIFILWLTLRMNKKKYICLCKCWHVLAYKYYLKSNELSDKISIHDNDGAETTNLGMSLLASTVNEPDITSIQANLLQVVDNDNESK
eukprot:334331_1